MRAAPLTTRRPLGCARVKPAQDDGAKTDPPAVVAEFLHTDQLARETLTDEHRVPAPLDLAIVAHPPDDLGGGVGQLGQPLRIRPRRGLVDGGGRPLPQRLVRPLVVEDVAKLVEAALLGPPRRLRGLRGFLLESEMHPLMPSIFFGVSGPDALRLDAELDPPHRQPRQPGGRGRGERRPIVGAHGARQAILAKRRLEQWAHVALVRRGDDLTSQQKPTGMITERKGGAPRPVAGPEPALEVGTPDLVWLERQAQPRRESWAARVAAPRNGQPLALQQGADRTWGGPVLSGGVARQPGVQLARPPARMAPAQPHHPRLDGDGHRQGLMLRGARAIAQPLHALGGIAGQQLVARLAADPVPPTHRAHRVLIPQTLRDKAKAFVHRTGCPPRHGQASLPSHFTTCYLCARSILLPMCPVWTTLPSPPVGERDSESGSAAGGNSSHPSPTSRGRGQGEGERYELDADPGLGVG